MNGLNQDDVKVKRKVKENILRLKIRSISFGEKNIVSQCKFGKPGLVFNVLSERSELCFLAQKYVGGLKFCRSSFSTVLGCGMCLVSDHLKSHVKIWKGFVLG